MNQVELITGTKKLNFDYPILMDVSGWQTYPNTGYGTNFKKAKENGISGASIRAGSCTQDDGVLYMDYDLLPNAQLSNEMSEEFPRWFYWYMRPQHGGKRQALKFIEYLDEAGVGDSFVGLEGDFEDFTGKRDAVSSEMNQFMEVIRWHFPHKKHKIYSSARAWIPYARYCQWASFFDLWIAIYPNDVNTYSHPWQNTYYHPLTWDDWTVWQWTDKGDGPTYGTESKQVDLSFFNGTYEQFYEYCDMSVLPPVTVPEPEPPVLNSPLHHVQVTTYLGLNLRPSPDTNGKSMGALLRGAVVPIYAYSGAWGMVADRVWIHTRYTQKLSEGTGVKYGT